MRRRWAKQASRWWFETFFIYTPIPGEMIQFDEHIFQRGWFNHQLGLLEAEAKATVIYKRNEVEAATKADVQTQGLFHLNIPPDLKTISGFAFQDCTNLVSVALTQSVTHIGSDAFSCCFSLARITLGDSVTHIGDNAFRSCASLKSVTMGDSLTHIGDNAFRNCTSLVTITCGDSVTHIGDNAFRNCTSLVTITCGDSVTHIGKCAFEGCTMLHLFGKDYVGYPWRAAFAEWTLGEHRDHEQSDPVWGGIKWSNTANLW